MSDLTLRAACIHGRYDDCNELITNGIPIGPDGVKHPVFSWKPCPGGRDTTIPDGELTWMRVAGTNDDQKTYVLKPGGNPAGGDDQWEEVAAAIGDTK